jgi:hypothetical protein
LTFILFFYFSFSAGTQRPARPVVVFKKEGEREKLLAKTPLTVQVESAGVTKLTPARTDWFQQYKLDVLWMKKKYRIVRRDRDFQDLFLAVSTP